MSPRRQLDFCFDYLSPYAYFAWRRIGEVCAPRHVDLRPRPVLLAGLLEHWGQLGPAEIPPKRQFVLRDTLRIAARRKLPFVPPAVHPFNPLLALRLSLPEVSGERQRDVVEALFAACWGRGENVSDEAVVTRVLGTIGLDAASLIERTREPEIKAALRASTEHAIARGVFGVPTILCDDQLFWGDDQMQSVADVLDGKDPIDARAVDALTAAARGEHRPGKG